MATDSPHEDPKIEAAAKAMYSAGFMATGTPDAEAIAHAAKIVEDRWGDASRHDREHWRALAAVAAKALAS